MEKEKETENIREEGEPGIKRKIRQRCEEGVSECRNYEREKLEKGLGEEATK